MQGHTQKKKRHKEDKVLGVIFIAALFLFLILGILLRDKDVSETENRPLSQKPAFSVEQVASGSFMKQFESYASDQFPGRGFFRSVHMALARFGGVRENNGVFLGKKKSLMEEIVLPDPADEAARIDGINSFSRSHAELNTSVLLVPDAAGVMEKKLPPLADTPNQKQLLREAGAALDPGISFIDLTDVFSQHSSEPLYYRTDHHWTSLGCYYAFLASADALGIENAGGIEYDVYAVSDSFNGVLSGTGGFLSGEEEEIDIYVPKERTKVLVNYVDEQKKRTSLYDSEKLSTKDQYAVFLGGNSTVIDIRTSSGSGRALMLVKDSFANSFVPFLAPHFSEIVVVDPRYYAGTADEILANYHISDVLFLYSGNTFFAENSLAGFLGTESADDNTQ